MQLKKGADVFSSTGEKIGSLDRVVLDPETNEVTHIIVEKGILFTSNKVIPVEYINLQEGDRITLEKNAQELERLPSYDDRTYINIDRTGYPQEDQGVDAVYWYPPVHQSWWVTAGGRPGEFAKPRFVVAQDVIPEGAVALEKGARVISSDGIHVGNVEEVIVETLDYLATHFVISEGLFLKERKLVPTPWIKDVDADQVTLSVESRVIDQLPEYESTS